MTKKEETAAVTEIMSYCGRCHEPTPHAILTETKKGDPDRCECKACNAKHKFRDPEKEANKGKGVKRGSRKKGPTNQEIWAEALKDNSTPGKKYKMNIEFIEGEILEHGKFGKGVVLEIVEGSKMKVIFETEEKLLVHNR